MFSYFLKYWVLFVFFLKYLIEFIGKTIWDYYIFVRKVFSYKFNFFNRNKTIQIFCFFLCQFYFYPLRNISTYLGCLLFGIDLFLIFPHVLLMSTGLLMILVLLFLMGIARDWIVSSQYPYFKVLNSSVTRFENRAYIVGSWG